MMVKKRKCKNCQKEYSQKEREKNIQIKDVILSFKSAFCCDECIEKWDSKIETLEERKRIDKEWSKIPAIFRNIESDRDYKRFYNIPVYIIGETGIGKSVFMSSLAREYICKKHSIMWISYPEFVMDVKMRFTETGSSYNYKQIANFPGPLFIDDIGVQKDTESVRELTYYIINHRETNKLNTNFTSNLPLSELEDRISSRISGMCKSLRFTGQDRRLNK